MLPNAKEMAAISKKVRQEVEAREKQMSLLSDEELNQKADDLAAFHLAHISKKIIDAAQLGKTDVEHIIPSQNFLEKLTAQKVEEEIRNTEGYMVATKWLYTGSDFTAVELFVSF